MNLPTVFILIIIAILLVADLRYLFSGKGGCGCSHGGGCSHCCENCSMHCSQKKEGKI